MTKVQPTRQTQDLAEALRHNGIHVIEEHWDGHKHVDIYIPKANLNIEVNGLQHYTNPQQIIADLKRVHYSDDDNKCYTLSITNQLIETHLDEVAGAIVQVVKEMKIADY